MSLSDMDFSLFGGELLLPPPSVYDDEVVTKPQDGQKTIPPSVYSDECQTSVISLGQDVLSNEATSGGLLQDWLDTPVDLLTLFTQDRPLAVSELPSFGIDILSEVKSGSTGLNELKNLSEQIAFELSTEAPAPQVGVFSDTDLSGQVASDVYDTGLGLLELLTTTVDESQDLDELTGLDLLAIDTFAIDTSSPILSPMSPEDVETILSSGPTSPVSCSTESQHQNIISLDDSFLDFTTMDTSSISQDLWDLTQMVNTDDQSSPVSDHAIDSQNEAGSQIITLGEISQTIVKRNRKSRPKPYEHSSVSIEEFIPILGKSGGKILDKKKRKKQQNKDAATRYRQKKKMEQGTVTQELEQLEERNGCLKDKVDQMTKEIRYLKNLLVDVQKAKLKKLKGTSK